MTATEYVVLVDGKDQEIGLAEKILAHEKNLLHRAFSVFVFRQKPTASLNDTPLQRVELLLQQRAFHKYHSGGLWTNTCCSHPCANENIVKAGERRLREELGISTSLKNLGWFHYMAYFPNGMFENEIDYVLVGMLPADDKVNPHPDEVHAYRWIGIAELEHEIVTDHTQFTPWLTTALEMVKAHLENPSLTDESAQ